MVEISQATNKGGARILAKVESFNPGGSVKDRVAARMIQDAENSGLLKPGGTVIEPTSGNTGVGLALICAIKRYRLILTMPETMSIERQKLAAAYGAKIVLTPGELGMQGAIDKAKKLREELGGVILQQFENPSNPASHESSTGPEIWRQCGQKLDAFVAGVGTGGTFTGVGRYLRSVNPDIELIAVEPELSAVLSGEKAAPHPLQGIGAGFVPAVMDTSLISRVVKISAADAASAAKQAAAKEGLLVGISSGAALRAALKLSNERSFDGKTIVVLLPDTGERYLSTWLFD